MSKNSQDRLSENFVVIVELIKSAREGSQDAFAELKRRYTPLIESQISKHTLADMSAQDVDDLREEATSIFVNAVCNYDLSAEGVEFGLYAKICIGNGLVSFVRSYLRRKSKTVISLELAEKAAATGSDPLQSLVDKENEEELMRAIKKCLSDYENRVWWLYVSGMSVSDVAAAIGEVDSRSVSNAIYRIRRKLRSKISDQRNFE
ncbi:MAG: sigma-70 family RNA polymerase sigma factor [Ruminococcaceae bacterium]|nr:sigma-70 family RNA polymerase sigma factor [Oscillospiraceae bacterium]